MTTLADLFTDSGERAVDPAGDAQREADEATQLEGLFARPRRRPVAAASRDDQAALAALVGDRASATSVVAGGAPAGPRSIRRGRSGRDWMSIAVAIVAVLAIAAAGVVTAVALTSASPASDAMKTLTQAEAGLVDGIDATNRSIASVEQTRDAAVTQAESLSVALQALSGMSDETQRASAVTAVQQYVSAVTAIELPARAAAWQRPQIDTASLASVGTAIDAVGERSLELETTNQGVAESRKALTAADTALAGAVAAFASTIPAAATAVIDENPDTADSFRAAVESAAAGVAASDLLTPAGLNAVTAYTTAVDALRAEQVRVIGVMRDEQAVRSRPGGGTGEAPVTPTPGDQTPVDPAPVDPAPVDPAPVDPAPVDPAPVDPVPTDPPTTAP